jgi:hypothetical protein
MQQQGKEAKETMLQIGTKILKKGLTVITMSEDSFIYEGKWRWINICT